MARIRRDAEKGKWWKGAEQNLKKIKRRQVKGCQRNMCWLRDKNWNKKKEWGKNKGKKNEVKTNINQNKNGRDRGWEQRTKNWGCIQCQRKKWRARNKRKVGKRCTKGGCGKRVRWQKKSKSMKKTGFKMRGRGGRGKTHCRRKAKKNCRWGRGWKAHEVVQRKPKTNQESIDPVSYLKK